MTFNDKKGRIYGDTEEEALAAVDEVNELHRPTGKRAGAGYTPVVIIDDLLQD